MIRECKLVSVEEMVAFLTYDSPHSMIHKINIKVCTDLISSLTISIKVYLALRITHNDCVWRCTPLIPALGGQRQVELCEFQASLICIVSYRPTTAT